MTSLLPATTRRGAFAWVLVTIAALALAGCGTATMVGEMFSSPIGQYDTGKSLPKRVVVIPFRSTLPEYAPRSLSLGRSVSKALQEHKGTVLVDHRLLEAQVKRLPTPGATQLDLQLDAARLLGVNTLVVGAVIDISTHRELKGLYGFRDNTPFIGMEAQIRVLDAATGTQLGETSIRRQVQITDVRAEALAMGEKVSSEVLDKLQAELEAAAAEWVLAQIAVQPFGGIVLEVSGQKVRVTGGSDNGLAKGDELLVFARGEAVKTGADRTLYLPGPLVGRVRLVEVGEAFSWAEPMDKKAKEKMAAFKAGQTVRVP